MSVRDYITIFEYLTNRSNVMREHRSQTISRFV